MTSNRSFLHFAAITAVCVALVACKAKKEFDPADGAPPAAQTVESSSGDVVKIDKPDRFALASATTQQVTSGINATGSVNPDVSREIPVLSLANGRVVALHVGLGDMVHKGELVMDVQSPDASTAFNTYIKASHDEHLTTVTLDRDKLLFDKGAIPQSQLQAAQTNEDDAKADLVAAEQQLKILGVDKDHPSETVKIYAPATGTIITQNVTASGAAGITYAGPAGSLLIADLSHVWFICDVYENDLTQVRMGEHADIRLNAFPGKVFSGVVSDIGAVLDPSIRTAKVRIQVPNPGNQLRIGLFGSATLSGGHADTVVVIPANSALQLHDRAYVFVPTNTAGSFRRVEIKTGRTLDGNMLEVRSGLSAGQQVVSSALDLQNTADQQ